jgi:hypothetical protein
VIVVPAKAYTGIVVKPDVAVIDRLAVAVVDWKDVNVLR